MSRPQLKERLLAMDRLIQAGQGEAVHKEIRLVYEQKIPRELAAQAANIARRVFLPSYSIKLLNPIVRSTGKKAMPATDEEKAEYAASLTNVGAAEEATALLEEISPDKLPQVLLFRAFSLFSQWDYAGAIPILDEYLRVSKLTDYQRLVGKVNLASAYLNERRTSDAERVLADILRATQEEGLELLRGNALEMSAQTALLKKDFTASVKFLDEGQSLLTNERNFSAFLFRKWRAILHVVKTKGDRASLQQLRKIKEEAFLIHEETMRDCDRYEAIYTKNKALFLHLYFGTPFKSFRDRLLQDFGRIEVPSHYDWAVNPKERKASQYVDVFDGSVSESRSHLKRGQLAHRLLLSLSNDFYMPIRIAALHRKLYPGTFYNPTSSPHQVHEAIRKLRLWLGKTRIPLDIEEKRSFYRLKCEKACVLRVRNPDSVNVNVSKEVFFTEVLKRSFAGEKFSASQASSLLKLPLRTTQRLLARLCDEGTLKREGDARAIQYNFL